MQNAVTGGIAVRHGGVCPRARQGRAELTADRPFDFCQNRFDRGEVFFFEGSGNSGKGSGIQVSFVDQSGNLHHRSRRIFWKWAGAAAQLAHIIRRIRKRG